MKYGEKLEPILNDVSNKEVNLAGGGVVGIVLSTTNALIEYICNLTIGKKNYQDVQEEVLEIQKQAQDLKKRALDNIDKDKEIVGEILAAYKMRKDDPQKYEQTNKNAVEFCVSVTKDTVETLKLVDRISKIGNKMLASDFKICKHYAFASVESSIDNVEVNLAGIKDEVFCAKARRDYENYYREAANVMGKIYEIRK